MKNRILLFAVIVMALAAPQSVKAYDFSAVAPSGQTLYYNIVVDHAEVTNQNGPYTDYSTYPTGNLVIPSSVTYGGSTYNVTRIGERAFKNCSGLTSVTIPNSVTNIGSWAFENCSGLTSVTIPNSVTIIDSWVFENCSGLTSITIPNSVTNIGSGAFSSCTGLTSVTIPNSVTSIGDEAFCNVHHIEYYGSASGSLWGAISMNGYTEGDFVYSDNTKTNLLAYIGTGGNVTIPNSVTSIGTKAFYGCSGLTSVTIPNSVTSIGDYAFYYCSGLTSVTIPNSVTSIGYYAFVNCSGLTSVTIPNSVTYIGSEAFSGCIGLTSVTIPNSVIYIGDWAFYYCSGLTSVTIPNSVTSIGYYAFGNCSGLTSVTISNSVTSIRGGTFSGCSSLTSVIIPNSVTCIGDYAFENCSGLTSVTIPNSVTSIGGGTFSGCSSLTSVTIPNSVTSIGGGTFSGCSSLTSVIIPNSVTCIGDYAFENCSGLTSVTIPNSVTEIGSYALYGCSSLTSVYIPNSVTSIGNYAFKNCSGLTEITSIAVVAPSLGDDVFYNVPDSILIYIPCGSTSSYQPTWNYFSNFIEPSVPNIDIHTADSTIGAATITTQPTCFDSTAVITATANYGYHFTQWNDGNTQNPRTVTLTQDTAFTAYFDRNEYQLTLNSTDPALGSVSGSGTYLYLDTAHIVANAIDHHHLLHWSDGDCNATRDIVITTDLQLTATFAIDTHTVSVVSSDIVRGMVETTGTEFVYGTPCTVTATAYTGYTFAGWSNGVTANPYTFAVISDVELTALFIAEGEEVYTVTVVSADPSMGSVSGGGQAMSGGEVSIRAASNPGYHFLRWNDNSTDSVRIVTVTANATYTAYFEANNVGIDDADALNAKVYSNNGVIVVEGANGNMVTLYDITGRKLAGKEEDYSSLHFSVPNSGIFLIKIGNYPVRKVVVIR